MKTISLFLALSISMAVISCQNQNQNQSSSKYHKAAEEIASGLDATNMNAGTQDYTMYVPQGWTTEHRTMQGVNYYFLLAPKTQADPNTSINVVTENMQNFSLDQYKAATMKALKRAIPSASILAEGDINAGGLKGVWYSYTMEPAGVKASIVGYIFPKDGIAYCLTAGTQMEDAARYRSTFDSVAKSFTFNGSK